MGRCFQRIHQAPIMRQCVCTIAAGSWEPVVAGEYLMREWILSLGRLSTVCILNHTQTHTARRTCMHTHTRWHQFLCCSTVSRQAGASEGDIRVFCITQDVRHTRKRCLLLSTASTSEIIGTRSHARSSARFHQQISSGKRGILRESQPQRRQ